MKFSSILNLLFSFMLTKFSSVSAMQYVRFNSVSALHTQTYIAYFISFITKITILAYISSQY